jgi:hypothetical protein
MGGETMMRGGVGFRVLRAKATKQKRARAFFRFGQGSFGLFSEKRMQTTRPPPFPGPPAAWQRPDPLPPSRQFAHLTPTPPQSMGTIKESLLFFRPKEFVLVQSWVFAGTLPLNRHPTLV